MIPWILLDTARMPGSTEDLRLKRRGQEYSIMLGATELMNSRLSGSERALATLSCERFASQPGARILIGGLGMGFTLRAALDVLGNDARIEVAELVPAVVAWARGAMADVFAGSLDDRRITIVEADVGAVITARENGYDAILLDVDNGPEGLTRKANDGLYDVAGLRNARKALRPGGVLAVWSQGPDSGFASRLKKSGFTVEQINTRANGTRGARHVIWLAVNPDRKAGVASGGQKP